MRNIITKISNKVTNVYDKAVVKASVALQNALSEERGASDLIAVVVLIVILLAVALLLKTQLINIVNAVGQKVISWIQNG